MKQVGWLEAFDEKAVQPIEDAQNIQDAYDRGFKDANTAIEATQNILSEQLVQAVADLQFNYVEAQAELADGFIPLLTAISDQLLPEFVDHALRLQVQELLRQAASSAGQQQMHLSVHPSQAEILRETLLHNGPEIAIQSDPKLQMHSAWIGFGSVERHLDLTTIHKELVALLMGFTNSQTRTA